MEIKTINLDSSTAKQDLESVQEGALFKCVTQLGRESKWFTGYFSSDTGVFWMAQQQEGGFRLSQSDAEELVDYAIGNISEAECSWYEPEVPTKDELEVEAEYQSNRYHGAGCLPFDGGVM